MSNELQTLTKQVADSESVQESAIILLNGLKSKLDAAIASGSPAALQSLSDSLGKEQNKLSAAILANTPTPAAPVFDSIKLPDFVVGTPVDYQFNASGAVGYALGTGAFPSGVEMDNLGHLTGTPTSAASFTFSVTASNTTDTVDSGALTVVVAPAAAPAPVPAPAPAPAPTGV